MGGRFLSRFVPSLLTLLVLLGGIPTGTRADDRSSATTATIDTVDGSRLVGTLRLRSLSLVTDVGELSLTIDRIAAIRSLDRTGTVRVEFANGDRLTGRFGTDALVLSTPHGDLTLRPEHIVSLTPAERTPAGVEEAAISFCGLRWLPWRTRFEVQGDKLVSLPEARPGFAYGHDGHGRGPMAVTRIGDRNLTDYRLEFDFAMLPVAAGFNPYGLPASTGGLSVHFRAQDLKESWNESGRTAYVFSLNTEGNWSLVRCRDSYCPGDLGYQAPLKGTAHTLAEGSRVRLFHHEPYHLRLEAVGSRIRVWLGDDLLMDLVDVRRSDSTGDDPIPNGGFGILWRYESMGWIRNVVVREL